jgi:hypothetical protein
MGAKTETLASQFEGKAQEALRVFCACSTS